MEPICSHLGGVYTPLGTVGPPWDAKRRGAAGGRGRTMGPHWVRSERRYTASGVGGPCATAERERERGSEGTLVRERERELYY
jgi:hypothetical protein